MPPRRITTSSSSSSSSFAATSNPIPLSTNSSSSDAVAVYRRRRSRRDPGSPSPQPKRPRLPSASPASACTIYRGRPGAVKQTVSAAPKRSAAAAAAAKISAASLCHGRRASKRPVVSPKRSGAGAAGRTSTGIVAAPAAGWGRRQTALVVAAPTKKRPPRSAELVRANCDSPADQLTLRTHVRRARITYESLRLFILFQPHDNLFPPPAPRASTSVMQRRNRADLKAAEMMGHRDLWLHREHRLVGPVPGVEIGDVFFYRMELLVVGLHGSVQGGIDFVPSSKAPTGEPIATSIVVSGGYEDDEDRGDELIYTGQGGKERNAVGISQDQKLETGNLALERSREYGIEVRVIRGSYSKCSPSGKVYVYDGLYKVVDYWKATSKGGCSVYKFRLLRVVGQEQMGSHVLKLADQLKECPTNKRRGCLYKDISKGKESVIISVYNEFDQEDDPLCFNYLVSPDYPPFVLENSSWGRVQRGCQCIFNCSKKCACMRRNGGVFAYDESGILLKGKPLIYECGPLCKCPPSCPNRVSQKGVMHRLEVFRSGNARWGVRSLDLIRAGSFVCEISGVVLASQAIPSEDDYLIHPAWFPERWMEWGDVSDVFPEYKPPTRPCLPRLSFALDVSKSRNVGCYLAHSSWPNLFVQPVLYDHYNLSYPHLMVFAMENIPPLTELCIDHGVGDQAPRMIAYA